MKKKLSFVAVSALAVSAVAVTAPASTDAAVTTAKLGFYDTTTNTYYTVAQFQSLTQAQKKALVKDGVYLYTGKNVISAKDAVLSTNAQLPSKYIAATDFNAADLDAIYAASVTPPPPVTGELKVESVSAINSTQVEIKFNQAVNTKAGVNGLSNFYFSLTDDVVIGSDLFALNSAGYTADFAKDGKSVIITADYSIGKVIWNDTNSTTADAIDINVAGDEVVKNKTVYVQARDLVLADGKLADTVEDKFVAKDTVAPKIADIKYDDSTPGQTDITVKFDEPVVNTNAEFYFDSNKLNTTAVGSGGNGLALDTDGKTLTFTVSKELAEGKYAFEAVGVRDLADNAPAGDVLSKDLVVETVDADKKVPELLDIVQAHDGAFYAVFNMPVNSANVTVKNLQNNTDELYVINDTSATVSSAGVYSGKGTQLTKDDEIIGYSYQIDFAADADTSSQTSTSVTDGDVYAWGKVYKTSTQISRSIVVDDIVSYEGTKGKKATTTETFVLDNKAPVVVGGEHVAATATTLDTFNITFNDAPFNGDMTVNNLDVIVKVVVDGETKSATINVPSVTLNAANNYTLSIALDPTDPDHENLFNDSGKIYKGDYKFELPRGLVTDIDDVTTPQALGVFSSIAATQVITVNSGTDASVPQTAKGLVHYNTTEDSIYVYFVGKNIDPTTATTAANYSVAGNTLTNASKFEYTSLDDLIDVGLSGTPGGLVKIFLEDNTIVRDGQYTLTVKNVATKSGAKMLPTSLPVVGLVDNTAPKLQTAVITGDGQLELTFDESVEFDSDAVRNFVVKVGTEAYNVEEVAKKPLSNDRVLVIHTKDVFNANGTVNVELKRDQNNDMFVTDIGGNEAAVKTVRATKLQ